MHIETLQAVENIAQAGGRIVITFVPTNNKPIPAFEEKTVKEKEQEKKEAYKKDTDTGKDRTGGRTLWQGICRSSETLAC